ncbi:MAG: UDP-N-acetylmuramate dehydrogenase [Anaerolineales bacterium]|nr:UDP-N-acetylmuramate dehydrogenase [Anaerolineales bacterium]
MTEDSVVFSELCKLFGGRMVTNAPLAHLTSSQVGGPADGLISVQTVDELVEVAWQLYKIQVPFLVLGGGSNVLVSDAGFRGVVIHNMARDVHFDMNSHPPTAWAASGANFGLLARKAVAKDLTGLEWAAGIPGSVGGAVIGNAGAHGSEMANNLILAEILHLFKGIEANNVTADSPKREEWPVNRFDFNYRSSNLKRKSKVKKNELLQNQTLQPEYIVLSALIRLEKGEKETIRRKLMEFSAYRQQTQPPGASMGSMFKNPPGDHAGRLIEAAGLKGMRVGQAEISKIHANFFINLGGATASEIWELIQLVNERVEDRFGIKLDLEIELIGDWIT